MKTEPASQILPHNKSERAKVCGNCLYGKSTSLDDTRCYFDTPYLPTGRHCRACDDWFPCVVNENPKAPNKPQKDERMDEEPRVIDDVKLLPCPFCGGKADMEISDPHAHTLATFMPDSDGSVMVSCSVCSAAIMVDGTDIDAGKEAWNKRTTSYQVAKLKIEVDQKTSRIYTLIDDCEKQEARVNELEKDNKLWYEKSGSWALGYANKSQEVDTLIEQLKKADAITLSLDKSLNSANTEIKKWKDLTGDQERLRLEEKARAERLQALLNATIENRDMWEKIARENATIANKAESELAELKTSLNVYKSNAV